MLNTLISVRTELDGMIDLSLAEALVALSERATSLPSLVQPMALVVLGSALGERERFEEALNVFQRSIEVDPDNALAHAGRGVVCEALGRTQDALEAFERAVELDPEDAVAQLHRGTMLNALDRDEEALEAFERAVELDPESALAHARSGAVLSKLGRSDEARQAFERAADLNQSEALYPFAVAVILLLVGNLEIALEHFREALRRANEDGSLASTYPNQLCQAVWFVFKDPQRASAISELVEVHAQAEATEYLGRSLVDSTPLLLKDNVGQSAAESWKEEWEAAAEGHTELEIPLELLRAAVAWKGDRDKAHLLALPSEQREILMQLLQLT